MTYNKEVKKQALELIAKGYVAEKVVDILSKEHCSEVDFTLTPKTVRNWEKAENQTKQVSKLSKQELTLARQHDIEIFRKSDDILTEGNVTFYTNQLQTPDWSFSNSIIYKVDEYWHYFSQEGNKHVIGRLREFCDRWMSALLALEEFAGRYYFVEGDRQVFMPVGYQSYLDSTDEANPEYKKIASELATLAKKAYKAYIDYRKAIKNTLYV